ncbi:adenylate kinase 7 isoform X3 [Amphiprion ocellaris]|uniref:adenylate kinase 7 isoform X3 n=1 Tax=Amphiprion ocellaris TaxID=80972 RepID=UPI002410CCAF|nr:adenylate kinase 7 isoform X3 [Amphiprion ocellaris]
MATAPQQQTAGVMAEPRIARIKQPKKVFMNSIDSYSSRYISKLLCECVLGAAGPEEEVEEVQEDLSHSSAAAFQLVGTVSHPSEEDRTYVLEEYFLLSREELLSKLMDCDVVLYNISQHPEQLEEALWAVSALHNEMERFSGPKLFILISTVMTWACSKPVDPDDLELPFTDEIFWSRRPHPNFKPHIDLEKRVVKMGKTNRMLFSTYVVASGLQYGMGEQLFHYYFKKSWLGQEQEISIFGDGKNIIPTIHINDLARLDMFVVQNIIEHQPKPYYLIAVDGSNNTMEQIVKAVASELGSGKIQKKPIDEAYLVQDFSVAEIDSMLVNLRMEAVHIKKLFSLSWLCEFGLVENIELVVEEYRQVRGLLPIRLCVLGPPAVGKSTVSKKICEHYKLHHITLKDTISETISQLEAAVKKADPDAKDSAAEAQELLSSLKDAGEQNEGVLDEQLKVLKDKLMSNPCRNQGFVLDDFPKTYEQAKELFEVEEHDGASQTSYSRKVTPEFVLYLDASDSFLMDRVMNLPERLVQEHSYEPELFLKRLARFRENSAEEETVDNYFVEMDISPLYLEITSSHKPDCSLLMQKIVDTVGQPRNYGPSSQEVVEEEERRKAEQRIRTEIQERTEEEQKEAEEARSRAKRWEDWIKSLEEVRQQEEEQLEALSVPMRSYLMEHVLPTLTQGLTECCRAQPPDPVDFLAEYLLKNNPFEYPQ